MVQHGRTVPGKCFAMLVNGWGEASCMSSVISGLVLAFFPFSGRSLGDERGGHA